MAARSLQVDVAASGLLSNQTVARHVMKDGKCVNKDPESAAYRTRPKQIYCSASHPSAF